MNAALSPLVINRSIPFDPSIRFGKGWRIQEQDMRSVRLAQIDLRNTTLETTLRPGERSITGEERMYRLKSEKGNGIRLDAGIIASLERDTNMFPDLWKKYLHHNVIQIFFDGTILLSPDGRRASLFVSMFHGRFGSGYRWLEFERRSIHPSVVYV